MRKFSQFFLSVALVGWTASTLVLSTPAWSEKSEIAATLAESLIEWIVANTELLSHDRPDIRFVTAEWMAERLDQKSMMAAPRALYGLSTHILYLPIQWSPSDIGDQSILLHELVHHLQSINETPVSCPAQYNGLAYQVQIAWLIEQGVSAPYEFLGINPTDIFVQSLCADPWGSLIDSWIFPSVE